MDVPDRPTMLQWENFFNENLKVMDTKLQELHLEIPDQELLPSIIYHFDHVSDKHFYKQINIFFE